MTFGKLLWNMIKTRKYSMREYARSIGMDCGNLCKVINDQIAPPKSPLRVWGLVGALTPTDEEVNDLMCAAYKAHAERLKIKWKQIK